VAFQRVFKTKVFTVNDPGELRAAFARAYAAGHSVVLQEVIPGGDENLSYCRGYVTDAGEATYILTSIKLASYPPHFGVGQAHETVPNAAIVEPTRRLLASIGYRGALFGAEWKLDRRDGRWKFIELNARSVGSVGVMSRARVNAVAAMWRDKLALPFVPPGRPRWGVHHMDFKNGLLLWMSHPAERPSLKDYLRMCRPPLSFYAFRAKDPRPLFADLWPVVARRFKQKSAPHDAGAPGQ
jgi:predicted ATP-grasp superfamily ATP-dependent carboligase